MGDDTHASGWPGVPPRWTSSEKTGVGTALSSGSHVWFTLSHGIVNEVYYPRVDQACTRDLGLIVTDGQTFFSEEKRDTLSEISFPVAGVPAYAVRNICRSGRYRLEKQILTDPVRDVLLQQICFTPERGGSDAYHVFVLLAPHLANHGSGNTGWVGDYKGTPMLFAKRDGCALALASEPSWLARSVGFVGVSDGWQELRAHKQLNATYRHAANGNVSLTGEIDLRRSGGTFLLALAFGRTAAEAGQHALASLRDGFDTAKTAYLEGWKTWRQSLEDTVPSSTAPRRLRELSAAILRTHEAKGCRGGVIASLSIPWGASKGDDDLGGYHLVWPRDLVEIAGGFLALRAYQEARRVLRYLQVTQEGDGHWSQNMWLDGTPYWHGIQMDETALPILLVDLAAREGALSQQERDEYWPMVERAATFLVRNGPVTPQGRWEEDPGYAPFTLATEVAALLVAADLADVAGRAMAAGYLRETADTWNARIERWLYVTGTELARDHSVDGYYVRVAQPDRPDAATPRDGYVPIKPRAPADSSANGVTVSPDALALVRFGLRAPDDPRITNTTTVIDALLKVNTPSGPAWRRYAHDAYGEHADGSAFDGRGMGRPWPLLTGERAHYELAAGHTSCAKELAMAMEAFAGDSGLLPEQIWDAEDIPDRELFFGQASGSARPLVWAHAEYLKLCRSLREGRVFDQPPQTVQRYLVEKKTSPYETWRFNNKVQAIAPGTILRIEALAAAVVRWSSDGWRTVQDAQTHDTTLGVFIVDLPTTTLQAGDRIDFTMRWSEANRWEGCNFGVFVE